MGKTFAEKVLGRAAGYEVRANEVVTVEPDVCMSHDNGGQGERGRHGRAGRLHEPRQRRPDIARF